ncbi:MAG: hypothetical protein IJT90_02265 [Bacteroidaceae bacterium]|nr:hypothetical protein [Bacteroidaceae bacterium]
MKNLFAILAVLTAGLIFVSCDNDDDYKVVLPLYEDVVFTQQGAQVNARSIVAGKQVTATLVQVKKGSGIYRYSYKWTADSEQLGLATYVKDMLDNADATCTFTPSTPGDYTLTIDVDYNYGSSGTPDKPSCEIPNGSVVYTMGGAIKSQAKITKQIRIVHP